MADSDELNFTNSFRYGDIIAANVTLISGSRQITKDYLYHAGHMDKRGMWLVGDNGVSTIYNPDDFRRATAAPQLSKQEEIRKADIRSLSKEQLIERLLFIAREL